MSSIKRLVGPVIIAMVIVCLLSSVKGEDTSEKEHLCNPKTDADESQEEYDISYLISLLIDQTPTGGYNSHITYNGYFGKAACNGQISHEDCDDCLDYANNVLYKTCGFSDGAQIKLSDCRLRVEHYEIKDADW